MIPRARRTLLASAVAAALYLAAYFGRGPLAGSGLPGTRVVIPPPPAAAVSAPAAPPLAQPRAVVAKRAASPAPPPASARGMQLRDRGEALLGRRTPTRVDEPAPGAR